MMLPSRQKRIDTLEKLRELKKSIKENFFVGKHKPEVNNNATKDAATSKERSSNKPENDKPKMGLGNKRTFNPKGTCEKMLVACQINVFGLG